MNSTLREALRTRRSGAFLYISPSQSLLKRGMEGMLKAILCQRDLHPACDCPSCFSVIQHQHPEVHYLSPENFSIGMEIAFSYPTPVVAISDVHLVPQYQQMQLLTWMESYSNRHAIVMTALNEQSLLPTILSRSMLYRDIPKESLTEEERQRTFYQLKALIEGKARMEEWEPTEHEAIARRMELLLIEDLSGRLETPPKKVFAVNQMELTTLTKLIGRYLQKPAVHNLPVLLRSFSTLMLQNVR